MSYDYCRKFAGQKIPFSTMVLYTSLAEVEHCKVNGRTIVQVPTLVYIANFVAANPYPRKFIYMSCPAVKPTGLLYVWEVIRIRP